MSAEQGCCHLSGQHDVQRAESWKSALLQESVAKMIGSNTCRQGHPAALWLAMPVALRIHEKEHCELNSFYCHCIDLFFSSHR